MQVFSSSEYQRIPALPTALVNLTNERASKLPTNSRRRRRRHHQEAVRSDPTTGVKFFLFVRCCPHTAGMLVRVDKDRLVDSLCFVMSSVVTPISLKSPVTRSVDALKVQTSSCAASA